MTPASSKEREALEKLKAYSMPVNNAPQEVIVIPSALINEVISLWESRESAVTLGVELGIFRLFLLKQKPAKAYPDTCFVLTPIEAIHCIREIANGKM